MVNHSKRGLLWLTIAVMKRHRMYERAYRNSEAFEENLLTNSGLSH